MSSPTLVSIYLFLDYNAPSGCEKWHLTVVVTCISLVMSDGEHLSICRLATYSSFFGDVFIQILRAFKKLGCPFIFESQEFLIYS